MTDTGTILWLQIGDKRVAVKHRGIRFVLFDELGHGSISGEAWCCLMEDGSHWMCVHDLMTGKWIGERVGDASPWRDSLGSPARRA